MMKFSSRLRSAVVALAALGSLWLSPTPAGAWDGLSVAGDPTYYEEVVASASPEELESTSASLPTSLHIVDSTGTVAYTAEARGEGDTVWTVTLQGSRAHERIDAVYHVVLVLPLPVDAAGRDAFTPLQWGLGPDEGPPGSGGAPLVYGGEKVVLKRSVALEKSLLPNLIGATVGKLPDLAGTGYDHTLWDTVLLYDGSYGNTVEVSARFEYSTERGVPAPDSEDDRFKAHVVTWVPTLDPTIPPYTVALDIVDP